MFEDCSHDSPNSEIQETRKEQKRRLLRQQRRSYTGSKARRRTRRYSRHQVKSDRIKEEPEEINSAGLASTNTATASLANSVRKEDAENGRSELDKMEANS